MPENWLRDFHDLLARAGVVDDAEPKAVCSGDRLSIAPSRRLYFVFTKPQRCAICGDEIAPQDAIAFE